jgi:CHAT domain-containing protein
VAALPGSRPATYLLEEVAIAVVPVPQLLPELLRPHGNEDPAEMPPSLLVVGEVDYDAAPKADRETVANRSAARPRSGTLLKWPALEETGDEATLVRKAFARRFPRGSVQELTGQQATEAAVRQQAARHRFLHLATHGFFAPQKLRSALAPRPEAARRADLDPFGRAGLSGFHPGLLSGLVLAGANRKPKPGQDDGILTALEVAELDLGGVELTVLSACETGLGAVAGGEGLLGLQRAFQVAGAKSVVASLWKVDDKASRELMVRFYKNLWGNKPLSKLEALRQAQLWMLREGGKRGLVVVEERLKAKARVPPYYWAAFQLSGDWR